MGLYIFIHKHCKYAHILTKPNCGHIVFTFLFFYHDFYYRVSCICMYMCTGSFSTKKNPLCMDTHSAIKLFLKIRQCNKQYCNLDVYLGLGGKVQKKHFKLLIFPVALEANNLPNHSQAGTSAIPHRYKALLPLPTCK